MILLASTVNAEEDILVKDGDFSIGTALPKIVCENK